MRMMRIWGMGSVLLALLAGSALADAEKSWGPQVTASNPRHVDRGELTGVVGPRGQLIRCGGKPLLIGDAATPPGSPRLRRVKIEIETGGGSIVTGPLYVPRCAGPGRVAWYVQEEDPLRGDSYPGAPIALSLPVPGIRLGGEDLGWLVQTGGCVAGPDGIYPPCAPPPPDEVHRGKLYRTFVGTRLSLTGKVGIESNFVRGDSGSARVSLSLMVDGNFVGEPTEFELTGNEKRTLTVSKQFRLPAGRHWLGLKVGESGYDHVNVKGKSASLHAFVSKTFRLKAR